MIYSFDCKVVKKKKKKNAAFLYYLYFIECQAFEILITQRQDFLNTATSILKYVALVLLLSDIGFYWLDIDFYRLRH